MQVCKHWLHLLNFALNAPFLSSHDFTDGQILNSGIAKENSHGTEKFVASKYDYASGVWTVEFWVIMIDVDIELPGQATQIVCIETQTI